MELLLDTHVFLWWNADPGRLSEATRSLIADPDHRVWISAASAWEMAIKRRSGKLSYANSVGEAITSSGFLELPILVRDAEAAGELEWDHSDPFDRLLVAQARSRNLTLVTADASVRAFGGVAQIAA